MLAGTSISQGGPPYTSGLHTAGVALGAGIDGQV